MAYGTNGAFGLKPVMHLDGSTWNGQLRAYPVASLEATSMYTGDPIYFTNTGTIKLSASGIGNPIAGVFMGVKYTTAGPASTGQGSYTFSPFWAGGTALLPATAVAQALICDDPTVLYSIQSDSSLNFSNLFPGNTVGGVLAANLFSNANVILGAGNATTGQSGATLGFITDQATAQLKIMQLDQTPGSFTGLNTNPTFIQNNFGVPYNNTLVMINNNPYLGGTGTLGAGGIISQVYTATTPLVAANINAMGAAPLVIVPAPAANFSVVINSFTITPLVIDAVFTGGGTVGLEYGNVAALAGPLATGLLPKSIFTVGLPGPYNFAPLAPQSLATITVRAGLGVYMSNTVAPFAAGGASSYTVTVNYSLVQISQ